MSCDVGEATESLESRPWPLHEPSLSCAHSPCFPSLHLRHSSFSNPSLALPTSQLILQPICCFTYVTAYSPTLLSLLLRHRIFTYVAWRAAHGPYMSPSLVPILSKIYSVPSITTHISQYYPPFCVSVSLKISFPQIIPLK